MLRINTITLLRTSAGCQHLLALLILLGLAWKCWSGPMATAPANSGNSDPQDFLIANWQTEDGLPQNSVTALVQTHDGYIWVGTINGLARFDGVRFAVFNVLNCPELPDNTIVGLFEACDGTLLIVTDGGGIAAFRNGRFERLQYSLGEREKLLSCLNTRDEGSVFLANSGLMWRWLDGRLDPLVSERHPQPVLPNSLCEDLRGTLWMIEQDGNPLKLAAGKLSTVPLTGSLAGATCQAMTKDSAGQIWLGTTLGLARLQDGVFQPMSLSDVATPFPVTELFPSRDGSIWVRSNFRVQKFRAGHWLGRPSQISGVRTWCFCLAEDRWGRLCVGSNAEGLMRVAEDGTFLRQDRNNGLPGNSVFCFLQDAEKVEWLGFEDAGLAQLRPRRFYPLLGPKDDQQAPALSVCQDHQGVIWAGTSEGGIYRVENSEVTQYSTDDLPLTHVWSICEDHQHRLWFSTTHLGVYQFIQNRFVQRFSPAQVSVRVNVIFEDSRGRLWFGGESGLQYLLNGNLVRVPLPTNSIYEVCALAEDHEGRIWAGTKNSGLICWQDGSLHFYTQANGLAMNSVWSLHLDSQDTLWIGTFGGGLSRVHDGKFVTYTRQTGLADDTISCILEDHSGWFWFCSPHGVFRVTRQDLEAFAEGKLESVSSIIYGRADGLPSSECTGGFQPAGWETDDGRLLLATLKGVAVVQPKDLGLNTVPPPVLIEEAILEQPGTNRIIAATSLAKRNLSVSEKTGRAQPAGELIIPPGENRLELRYTALSFTDPKNVRFRYRLLGLDSDWISAGNRRTVQYSHLRPGKYNFEVTACNNDGVWNETGATLAITMRPHIWQTWSFIGASTLILIAGLLRAASRYERNKARRKMERLEQLSAIERERTRIAEDIHDELGANLTRITLLSERVETDKDQPAAVETHSRKIAANARETVRSLDEIVWAINPHNDTLDSFIQYLSHYADEFLENSEIIYRLKIPTLIPPVPLRTEMRHGLFLVVKEALNNVVKHSRATQVGIGVKLEENRLEIVVEDNGCGLSEPDASVSNRRNGLANMRARMESLKGSFKLENTPGLGTKIILNVKFQDATPAT